MQNLKQLSENYKLKLIICNNIFKKSNGFMFSKQNKILIFPFNKEKKQSIHMFFVFFPLKIYFLNNKKEVIEIKTLRPFTNYTSKYKSKYFIEIPEKYEKFFKIKINEIITW